MVSTGPNAAFFPMIRLLSTDFDGTLVNHFGQPPVAPAFLDHLIGLREDGVVWAVNTGRAVQHIVEGLAEFGFPISPDFVLTSERDVYRADEAGAWEPFGDWNARCEAVHRELFEQAGPLFARIERYLADETEAQLIFEGAESPAGIIAKDEIEMDRIVSFIEQERHILPDFHFQRNTMYLRFCHASYHKGAALGELGRLLHIPAADIFAVGDHHNDLSMLDGRFAAMPACPGNAVEEVKETVREAGGYVAEAEYSEGVLEALKVFAGNSGLRGRASQSK